MNEFTKVFAMLIGCPLYTLPVSSLTIATLIGDCRTEESEFVRLIGVGFTIAKKDTIIVTNNSSIPKLNKTFFLTFSP